MQNSFAQPDASRIPEGLAAAIVSSAFGHPPEAPAFTLTNYDGFSNDLAEARLSDGRRIMIKRGRYPWAADRFRASRAAAELLRREAGITAPRSLPLPPEVEQPALDAYWRIDLPTLEEVRGELAGAARREALRSLGALVRRVHEIRLRGHGSLRTAGSVAITVSQHLAEDLGGRLMPSVSAGWPEGVSLMDFLLRMITEVARRNDAEAVLLHGDLHVGNVLCERDPDGVRCVGLLDLESAEAGPKESDLARLAVMHTPLFNMPLEGPWLQSVMDGYGVPVDPFLFSYYSIYHLVQLGNHSASLGHEWHAGQVAAAARRVLAEIEEIPSQRPVLTAPLVC